MSWLPGGVLWVITVFIIPASVIPQNCLSGHQKWACAYSTKYSSRLVVRTEQLFWSMVYCWYVSTDGQFSDCKLILAVWTELGTDWIRSALTSIHTLSNACAGDYLIIVTHTKHASTSSTKYSCFNTRVPIGGTVPSLEYNIWGIFKGWSLPYVPY